MSYSIAPSVNPKPKGDAPNWMVLVISVSCVFILLVTLGIIYYKCRKSQSTKSSRAKPNRTSSDATESTVAYRDHLQTMTTGRGTDVEGMSNVYSSVLEDRDTLLSKK